MRDLTDLEKLDIIGAAKKPGGVIFIPKDVAPETVMSFIHTLRNPLQQEFAFMSAGMMSSYSGMVLSKPCAKKQSRKASAAESTLNILIGFGIQYAALWGAAQVLGIPISLEQNFLIGVFMTVVSFARSYALRRFFEYLRVQGVLP